MASALKIGHCGMGSPCGDAEGSPRNEWGFSNKMIDLTRHIDSVRKA